MITYKDITFCVASGCKNKCGRKLTKEIREEAQTAWKKQGLTELGYGPLFSVSYFCDRYGNLLKPTDNKSEKED